MPRRMYRGRPDGMWRVHTWNDFSGGDYGSLSPLKAPANSFSGVNVVPYLNGMIGPRAGLRKLIATLPDFPTGYRGIGHVDSSFFEAGPPWAQTRDIWVSYWDSGATKGKIVLLSSDPYKSTDADISAGDTGAWTGLASITRPAAAYICSGAGVYLLTAATPTLAGITNAPPSTSIVEWQGVFVVAGHGADNNKIFWSDDGPLTWPVAPNYDVIGAPISRIIQLFVLRDQLFVFKDDGTIWMVTGVLPTSLDPTTSASVRLVATLDAKLRTYGSAALGPDGMWFIGAGRSWPQRSNGSVVSGIDYLRSDIHVEPYATGYNDAFSTGGIIPNVVACNVADTGVLFVEAQDLQPGTSAPQGVFHNMNMLLLNNGAWTKHLPATRLFNATTDVTDLPNGKVAILTRTSAGVVEVYVWDVNLNQPPDNLTSPVNDYAWASGGGYVYDSSGKVIGLNYLTNPGTPFTTRFDTVPFVDPDGVDFMVRKVIIDFEVFYVNGMTPSFDVQVVASERFASHTAGENATISGVRTVTADPQELDTVNTHAYPTDPVGNNGNRVRRAELSFGDQGTGSAAYVRISNMVGVAIATISILANDEGDRDA